MNKYLILVFLYMACLENALAQVPVNINSIHNNTDCSKFENYIPNDQTPVKRLRFVIHVFAKADGSGNFRNNYAPHTEFIKRIFTHAQWYYAQTEFLRAPEISPNYYRIPDSRIRFVVDTIVFHYDEDAWNFKRHVEEWDNREKDSVYSNPKGFNRAEAIYNKYVADYDLLTVKQRDSALHIFLFEAQGHEGKGMAHNLFSKKWVYGIGSFARYVKDSANPNHWEPGDLFAHEIGHALGMYHPYDFKYCDDLNYSEKGKTNNFMDSYPGGGRAITPFQMGKMHKGLSGSVGNIHHILIKDYCFYDSAATIYISAGDTVYWRGERNVHGDIHVEKGAVLVVKCKLGLPAGASIYVFKGGTLILDGAEIYNACGASWQGVKLQKPVFSIFKSRKKPILHISNGGKILNAKTEVETVFF